MSVLKTCAIAFGATVAVGTVAIAGGVAFSFTRDELRVGLVRRFKRLRIKIEQSTIEDAVKNGFLVRIDLILRNQESMTTFKANKYMVMEIGRIQADSGIDIE